jgi:Icc-related predicted phosphoesterase
LKILATTDFHGEVEAFRKTVIKATESGVEVIVVCGDVTHFGSLERGRELLSVLGGAPYEVLFVPGNCDPPELTKVSVDGVKCIHGICERVVGVEFLGVGGSSPSPFDTPFELSEVEIAELLGKGSNNCQNGVDVLVSHSPPRYTKADLAFSGEHVGSLSVREFVEKTKPRVVLCGHIHEAVGMDRINESVVINPGPARHRRCAIIELNDQVNAKLDKL